ncbi:GspH/FimT family pseudopilin [Pseudomonas sp. NFX15]|uniref:GspH/FimT family pseudopilin n=1 Tax=Pseudomonas sp. NFX15 TaxID=2816958 RepID=UPI003B8DA444
MDHRTKGFTLIELLVALAILAMLSTLAVPGFTRSIQTTRADSEIADLQRALSFARLEAIERGSITRIRPSSAAAGWDGGLTVYDSTGDLAKVLRVVPAMSSGVTLALTSGVTVIDFNSTGGLSSPSSQVAINYRRGAQSRTLTVCLNGRIVVGGHCG